MEASDDNVMLVKTEAVSSDMAKKRKTTTPDENVSSKKRKLEVNDVDDDISIIESDINNDTDKAKSNFKIHKNSEDDDCLIVHDDNKQIAATSQ